MSSAVRPASPPRLRAALLLLVGSLAFASAQASATPVTVVMTGTWDSVLDTAGVLDGSVVPGGAFTVTLSYDDSAPDLDPSPSAGLYEFAGGSYGLALDTGSYTFAPAPASALELSVALSGAGDDVALYSEDWVATGPGSPSFSFLSFFNPSIFGLAPGTIPSDALVGFPWPALAGSLNVFFFGSDDGVEFVELSGDADGIVVIPEPASAALVGLGLAALAWRRRRG